MPSPPTRPRRPGTAGGLAALLALAVLMIAPAGARAGLLGGLPVAAVSEPASEPAPATDPTAAGPPQLGPAVIFSGARASCDGAGSSTAAVVTQWLLDGTAIVGATDTSYTPPRADDGHQLSCAQTATESGISRTLTSAARPIHEQPAQPAWPISAEAGRCTTPVCMQEGAAPLAVAQAYAASGAWWTAQQIRCVSAPWTSAMGDSAQPAIRALAEAHSVRLSLERVTPAGAVAVAAVELRSLAAPRDNLDGPATPFPATVVSAFGPSRFAAGELWPRRFTEAAGRPDWFAAGGGLIAYSFAGVARSFQLTYALGAEDAGTRLRCTAAAEDGPAAAPTAATFTSPAYAVSAAARCAPRRLGPLTLPQPAAIAIGDPRCLPAGSSLPAAARGFPGVAVKRGRIALAITCGLSGGCDGPLLVRAGRPLARARLRLRAGAQRVLELTLTPAARRRVAHAGELGLPAALSLATHGTERALGAIRLIGR